MTHGEYLKWRAYWAAWWRANREAAERGYAEAASKKTEKGKA
jgi:hypothetical protein